MSNKILRAYEILEQELFMLEKSFKTLSNASTKDLSVDDLVILKARQVTCLKKCSDLSKLISSNKNRITATESTVRKAYYSNKTVISRSTRNKEELELISEEIVTANKAVKPQKKGLFGIVLSYEQ
jgi:hypothetical protein